MMLGFLCFALIIILLICYPMTEQMADKKKSPVSKAFESRLDQVETDVASLTKKVNDAVAEMKGSIQSAADGLSSVGT